MVFRMGYRKKRLDSPRVKATGSRLLVIQRANR